MSQSKLFPYALAGLRQVWHDDPRARMSDFYALQALHVLSVSPEEAKYDSVETEADLLALSARPEAAAELELLRTEMARLYVERMRLELPFIVACELRHIFDGAWKGGIYAKVQWFKGRSEPWSRWYAVYARKYLGAKASPWLGGIPVPDFTPHKITDSQLLTCTLVRRKSYAAAVTASEAAGLAFWDVAEEVFQEGWSSSYGGPKWGVIAKACRMLMSATSLAEQIEAIDFANALQHNNCTLFNKLPFYHDSNVGLDWIQRVLDFKFSTTDGLVLVALASGALRTWAQQNVASGNRTWGSEHALPYSWRKGLLVPVKAKAAEAAAEAEQSNGYDFQNVVNKMVHLNLLGWPDHTLFRVEEYAADLGVLLLCATQGMEKKVHDDQPKLQVRWTGVTCEQFLKGLGGPPDPSMFAEPPAEPEPTPLIAHYSSSKAPPALVLVVNKVFLLVKGLLPEGCGHGSADHWQDPWLRFRISVAGKADLRFYSKLMPGGGIQVRWAAGGAVTASPENPIAASKKLSYAMIAGRIIRVISKYQQS